MSSVSFLLYKLPPILLIHKAPSDLRQDQLRIISSKPSSMMAFRRLAMVISSPNCPSSAGATMATTLLLERMALITSTTKVIVPIAPNGKCYALPAGDTFFIINHGDSRLRIYLQRVYRTALPARTHQIRQWHYMDMPPHIYHILYIWTDQYMPDLRQWKLRQNYRNYNMPYPYSSDSYWSPYIWQSDIPYRLKESHTQSYALSPYPFFLSCWRFALRQINSLSDYFSFLINAASKLCVFRVPESSHKGSAPSFH